MKRRIISFVIFSIFLILTLSTLASCAATTVSVTFDANGGSFSNGESTLSLEKGKGSYLAAPTDPDKTGEIFVGWSTDIESGVLWQFTRDRATTDMTLYAVWQAAEAKLIALEGANVVGDTATLCVGLEVSSVNLSGKATVSDFASWTLSCDSEGLEIVADGCITDIPLGESSYYITVSGKDGVLTELYTLKIIRDNYTVVYLDANGGELSDTEESLLFGESYTLPVPTRAGYTFLGWKLGDDLVTDPLGASLEVSDITEPVTLIAEWEKDIYTVSVSADKAGAGSVSGGGQFGFGDTVTLTASTYLGYEFIGWLDGEGELLSSAVSYSFSAVGSVEITASYELREEMEGFLFTSTTSTCVITGLSDTSVTEITLPVFITEIEDDAFDGATALAIVRFLGTREKWEAVIKKAADFAALEVTCTDDPPPSNAGGQKPGGNVDNNGWTEN